MHKCRIWPLTFVNNTNKKTLKKEGNQNVSTNAGGWVDSSQKFVIFYFWLIILSQLKKWWLRRKTNVRYIVFEVRNEELIDKAHRVGFLNRKKVEVTSHELKVDQSVLLCVSLKSLCICLSQYVTLLLLLTKVNTLLRFCSF